MIVHLQSVIASLDNLENREEIGGEPNAKD